mmetsp:Transcript_96591/g.270400  ORF Transcript_96591/g.270400 Transcript_96591/m.270400 type:complete len:228 (-) Transcript_96591:9-692(-)
MPPNSTTGNNAGGDTGGVSSALTPKSAEYLSMSPEAGVGGNRSGSVTLLAEPRLAQKQPNARPSRLSFPGMECVLPDCCRWRNLSTVRCNIFGKPGGKASSTTCNSTSGATSSFPPMSAPVGTPLSRRVSWSSSRWPPCNNHRLDVAAPTFAAMTSFSRCTTSSGPATSRAISPPSAARTTRRLSDCATASSCTSAWVMVASRRPTHGAKSLVGGALAGGTATSLGS